jgi:hypothetical protein
MNTSPLAAEAAAAAAAEPNPAADRLARAQRRESVGRIALPLFIVSLLLLGWEALVRVNEIPHYILPAPSLVLQTLAKNWGNLAPSLWFTVKLTLMALGAAVVGGVLIAMAFALSKWVEIALFPIAVVLQVTPIVAIAPLILIYVDSTTSDPWGFFDLLGNVEEWSSDIVALDETVEQLALKTLGRSSNRIRDVPIFPNASNQAALFGGAYNNSTRMLRSASRHYYLLASSFDSVGFRVARTVDY